MSRHSTPPSLPRLARAVVVVAICLSLGLQWAALQGIAWTGMLIEFSKEGTLVEAVSKTFNGDHPCPLCKAVEKGAQQQDQKGLEKSSLKKLDAVVVQAVRLVPPPGLRVLYPVLETRLVQQCLPPVVEPPRSAVA